MAIRHAFVSAQPGGTNLLNVQPFNWNEEHIIDRLDVQGNIFVPDPILNNVRLRAYSPAYQLLNANAIVNWYMGVNDDFNQRFEIGRGYGPSQGIQSALHIDGTNGVTVGDQESGGAAFSVATGANFAGGDALMWIRHESTGTSSFSSIRHEHLSGNQSPYPIFIGLASRGLTPSRVGIQPNDALLIFEGRGYDGSIINHGEYDLGVSGTAAQIAFRVAAAPWTGTSHPTYIQFFTTPAGSVTAIETIRTSAEGTQTHPILQLNADGQVQLSLKKCISSPLGPGAGYLQMRVEPGTIPGTLKLVLYSGTSTSGVVIADNVGAGN